MGLGLAVMALMAWVLEGTPLGAMLRAGVENESMASALGINAERLFFIIFCLGCALAGLAGVVAAPLYSASTGMGITMLVPSLIVVVVGGLGSLRGAIVGAFVVGCVETFGAALAPGFSSVLVYILLAMVLVWRPSGLVPARG
jgi:branched-chain amino acid transport system permease protein